MRRRDVHCKVCGHLLDKGDSGLYHCTNMQDLSHRGLIPASVVEASPRYMVNNRGFRTKEEVRKVFGCKTAATCKRIEKTTA